MNTTARAPRNAELLAQATDPQTTPFDYIVVGSGAGGGPLAARLALGGMRVLVLEAGGDPAYKPDGQPALVTIGDKTSEGMRQVYAVPAFHAAATEDPDKSWTFSVRHYDDDVRQRLDPKYDASKDPSASNNGVGKGGIQYPRSAAIGGCTAHHAMIIIRPNDADWDWIADRTNDPSWRSEHMQGYFPKIEQCLFYNVFKTFAHRVLGPVLKVAELVSTVLNPRRQLDPGGHGKHGWQPTSFIDPLVIAGIVWRDRTFLRVLLDVALETLRGKSFKEFALALSRLQLLQFLDPNVRSQDLPSRAHLSLISIGTDGKRRHGLREHLLRVQDKNPDRLVIEPKVHVTRVVFQAGTTPKAIGVELLKGEHLYRASPLASTDESLHEPVQYFAKREVIVCGGAFNTPQLLMLSGIGDQIALSKLNIAGPRDCAGHELTQIIDLPGVGKNLQDRYEVSVVSEAKADFSTLTGVTFQPDSFTDPSTVQWMKDGTGLYSTNGGALAMMMSSTANQQVRPDPDIFIFGVPAAFRGYYWGWSQQLLMATAGGLNAQRNLWTWVILKAYTNNSHGSVTLLSKNPLDTPQITFNSFDGVAADSQSDVDAIAEAVLRVREINAKVTVFGNEVQPGPRVPSGISPALSNWIRNEAWGHHACGTCRIGADPWRADPSLLKDPDAVLSSDFRVHGVEGLRVVDASVFPRIPGYFIVTPTFMIGEKAADILLANRLDYPRELEARETSAILARRVIANSASKPSSPKEASRCSSEHMPEDTIGLAMAGGGIRSATFGLGVLQALAMRKVLREVDIMSSVSGGGYAAAFLGRLYTRLSDRVTDKAGRVEAILTASSSPEIWWLRRHANYIDSGSRSDLQSDAAVVLRNLISVHIWLGMLLFGAFGLTRWVVDERQYLLPMSLQILFEPPPWQLLGVGLSPWWWLPIAVLLIAVIPTGAGYWLVLKNSRIRWAELLPLLLWVVLIACAVFGMGVRSLLPWGAGALAVLLFAWAVQEIAGWGLPVPSRPRRTRSLESDRRIPSITIVRNRLSRALGSALFGLALSVLWVILDSLARTTAVGDLQWAGWSMLGVAPLLPLLRGFASRLLGNQSTVAKEPSDALLGRFMLSFVAFALAFLLLFYIDVVVHWAFRWSDVGPWLVATALLASAVIGQTFDYLNLSSLQQAYAQKLVRNFLGASNDARVHPSGIDAPVPVNVPDPADDLYFDEYQPHLNGGPLHLIGTCVNDTVDRNSGRQLRGDKGLPMAIGPAGLSVGRHYHALWRPRDNKISEHVVQLETVRVDPDPNQFHVLARRDEQPVTVERLKLGQWTAISGAAYTTGAGRETTLARSLLRGLLNIRTGYWWNSGINAGQRPSRYPPGLWRQLKSLPARLFRVQATLLDEWRAWFPGASDRLWYLSDGGHFDNTGLYEMLRRRVPFTIFIDGGRDVDYSFGDLALLTRQARLDFGASLEWVNPTAMPAGVILPKWIAGWLNVAAIGLPADLKRDSTRCAALARVTYSDETARTCWVLLLKPCLGPDLPLDVKNYGVSNSSFPQDTTADQFFDDDQWESYRMLGQTVGLAALA